MNSHVLDTFKQIHLTGLILHFSYRYCKNKPYPKSRFCRGVPGNWFLCEVIFYYL